MLRALLDFFDPLFSDPYGVLDDMYFNVGHIELSLVDYLKYLCAYISLIIIIVLCCLFVYKIIKLVGNLIR